MPWNFFYTFAFDDSNYQLFPASAWSLTNILLFMIQANKDGQKLWLHGLVVSEESENLDDYTKEIFASS